MLARANGLIKTDLNLLSKIIMETIDGYRSFLGL
jgi:hypothetical protein